MKTLFLSLVLVALLSCANKEEKKSDTQLKDSTIGLDSTKIGSDSGILRKLP